MLATFAQSLSQDSKVAQGLQHNWDGGKDLPARLQSCVLLHTSCPHCICLARQAIRWVCMSHFCQPCRTESANSVLFSTFCSSSSPCCAPLEPANPRSAATPTIDAPPREAIVVSNPFVASDPDRIAAPSIHPVCGSFPEAGRARLTRFLGMSLDNSHATVSEMVSLGRFQHTGHATVRIEGASAWGMSSGGSLDHCT